MTKQNIKILLITSAIGVAIMSKVIFDVKVSQAKNNKPVHIVTVFELQQQLKDLGYYQGFVDGIVGRETLKAWDRAANDQMMIKMQVEVSQRMAEAKK